MDFIALESSQSHEAQQTAKFKNTVSSFGAKYSFIFIDEEKILYQNIYL